MTEEAQDGDWSDAGPLCTSCMESNPEGQQFCVECGAPIGQYVACDPFQMIEVQGHGYRNVLEGHVSPVALIAMWIIFGGGMVGAVAPITSGGIAGPGIYWSTHTELVEASPEDSEYLENLIKHIEADRAARERGEEPPPVELPPPPDYLHESSVEWNLPEGRSWVAIAQITVTWIAIVGLFGILLVYMVILITVTRRFFRQRRDAPTATE